jgi:hypothetical protein
MLTWVQDLITLMTDQKPSASLIKDIALQKLSIFEKCFANLPIEVETYFVDSKIVTISAIGDSKTYEYCSNVNQAFKKVEEYFQLLKSAVEKTESFETRVKEFVDIQQGLIPSVSEINWQSIATELQSLVVSPSQSVRRIIEFNAKRLTTVSVYREASFASLPSQANESKVSKKRKVDDDGYLVLRDREVLKDAIGTKETTSQSQLENNLKLLKRNRKGIIFPCLNTRCSATVNYLRNSFYCSDRCALEFAEEFFTSLTDYRKILCKAVALKSREGDSDDNIMLSSEDNEISRSLVVDLKQYISFDSQEVDIADVFNSYLKHQGMVYESQSKLSGSANGSMQDEGLDEAKGDQDALEAMLRCGEVKSRNLAVSARLRQHLNHSTTSSYLYSLPSAASLMLARDADCSDILDSQSPRSPRNSTAAPLPKSPAYAYPDEDIRRVVRLHFEDIFIASLTRSQYFNAISHGAILATELEYELFLKYSQPNAKGTKELNKKEYKKHQLMLLRNLKQIHNDHLVRTNTCFFSFFILRIFRIKADMKFELQLSKLE